MRPTLIALAAALLVSVFSAAAQAQSLALSLNVSSQSGAAGGAPVVFRGTLLNTGSTTLTLDGSAYSFNPDAPGFAVSDSSAFFTFLLSGGALAPGDSYSGDLFEVAIDAGVAPGTIAFGTATFTSSYTDPFGDMVPVQASADFQVSASSAAIVPEPGAGVLFALAAPAAAIKAMRRRHRRCR